MIGIKYDLLEQPPPKKPALKKEKKPKPVPPKEMEFSVTVKRTAVWETTIQVRAKDSQEARAKVESKMAQERFPESEAVLRNEIRRIHSV